MPVENRLRGLLVMLAVFVPVTVVATALTPGNRLFTAVTMSATFSVLIVIVIALWRFRPAWFVAGPGPMKDLDPEERLQVTQAVRSGHALTDRRLAEVASVVAVGTVRVAWLTIAVGGFNLAVRAWSLAVDRDTAPPSFSTC